MNANIPENLQLVFKQLENALKSLEEAINQPVNHSRVEIDGTIQRFKFCIELCWKFLKKKLFIEFGIEINGPKKVMQQAYANKLIEDEKMWMAMLDDRNLTSHTYDKALADKIYHNIKSHTPFLKQTVNQCKSQ